MTYEEHLPILAVVTGKVDKYGRLGGLKKYRGRPARVLILLEHPEHPRAVLDRKRI